jgi:hypothetical protein
VKYFSRSSHVITVLLKQLGERDRIWQRFTKVSAILGDKCCGRTSSRHEGGSARIAQRILAIRAVEAHALSSQLVNIGGADNGISVTT